MDDITRDVPLVSGDQIAEITPIHEGGSDATQIDPIIVGMPRQANYGTETVSISIAFHPTADLDKQPPDVILISTDDVFFYVHRHVLQKASINYFGSVLLTPPTTWRSLGMSYALGDCSRVLNVVLHTAYNLSVTAYVPSLDTLLRSIDAFHKYGMPFDRFLTADSPLFAHILDRAPLSPMDVYIAAAKYHHESLAIAVSSDLISFPMADITDEMCLAMGPVYLRRLTALQINRSEELRKLLLVPPTGHDSTPECGSSEQKKLQKEWLSTTAQFCFDPRPDVPTTLLETTLSVVQDNLTCDQCKACLSTRIRQLVLQWSLTKDTI